MTGKSKTVVFAGGGTVMGFGLIGLGFAGGYILSLQENLPKEIIARSDVSAQVEEIRAIDIADPNEAAPTYSVRPVADVAADGKLPTIVEVSHQDAVLAFRSSVPLACSVVYGKTPDFGMIATDLDMDGGGHTEHGPVLTGLEPETDYYYRVQGTAADGTIYAGETEHFRTTALPIVGASDSAPQNLARLGQETRIVAVSSNYAGAANDQNWGVNQAFDGNDRTAWSSNGDGDDAYLTMDFGGPVVVSSVDVWTRTMADGTAQIASFTLTGDDGIVHGPFHLPDASQAYTFEIALETTQIRFDVESSSGGNTGLLEFAVLGSRL